METLNLNDGLSVPLGQTFITANICFADVGLWQTFSPNVLIVNADQGKEVIRIASDGKLFWLGREVETDEEFRMAMMDLRDSFIGTYKPH